MIYRFFNKCNYQLTLEAESLDGLFEGALLPESWTPPRIDVFRKHRPLLDFVAFSEKAPVLTERALEELRDVWASCCQSVPLISVKGHRLTLLNVTRMHDRHAEGEGSPIFKVRTRPYDCYVSEAFVQRVAHLRLRGAGFLREWDDPGYIVHPEINNLDHLVY